jgi:hypothetical protein
MATFTEMYNEARSEVIRNTTKAVLGLGVAALGVAAMTHIENAHSAAEEQLSKYPEYHQLLKYSSVSASLSRAQELLTTRKRDVLAYTQYPEPGVSRKIIEEQLIVIGDLGTIDDRLVSIAVTLPQGSGTYMGTDYENQRRDIAVAQKGIEDVASSFRVQLPQDLLATKLLTPLARLGTAVAVAGGFMVGVWHGLSVPSDIRHMNYRRKDVEQFESSPIN